MNTKSKELIQKADDVMQTLREQTGETIALGLLDPQNTEGIVVAKVAGKYGGAIHVPIDFRFQLHCSAPGKVLVAFQKSETRNNLLQNIEFERHTPSTITERDDFTAELQSVVEKGYSIDVSELVEGCHCVGVPVFDEGKDLIASLWTTGSASKLPVRRFPEIAEILKKGSTELSLRLRSTGKAPNRSYIKGVVRQAREIIENNLHRPVDMKILSENLYVSYSWFRRVFREEVGQSPSAYHLNLRIEEVCLQLRNTDHSIRSISEQLGFKNQNHLSALFKRKIGLSPLNYRISISQKNNP